MTTLYRKYRPQNWQEVVGQNHIKVTLEQEIATDKLAHAYLFCGPRAVGKTTVARVLAKAINCPNRKEKESEPCNKCSVCEEITKGRSLDIMEIDAASHTGVDNVRENIIAAVRTAPSRTKYKVFIIDEAHMLSISAFNALLKVLEEPPENVMFILCTTEVHKIPTTIISRCQRFDFKRIGAGEITKKLQYIANTEKIKIDKEVLEAIARQSEGYMRDAESLLGQVVAIGGKEITREEADLVIPRSDLLAVIKLIEYLSAKDAGKAIGLVNKLLDEGINLKRFMADVIEVLRKIMLIKINPALTSRMGLEMGENIELKISAISRDLDLNQIVIFMEKFIAARNSLKGSFIVQLPVEIAIAELCVGSPALRPVSAAVAPVAPSTASMASSAATNRPSVPTPTASSGNVNMSKELIMAKWHEVLAKVKQHNHSLSFILRVCQPKDIKGNQLCLAFKYKFHKDRVGDMNIKRLIENTLKDVYGQPLIIEAVIDENLEVNGNGNGLPPSPSPAVNPGEEKKSVPHQDIKKENPAVANSEPVDAKTDAADIGKSNEKSGDDMVNNLLKNFGGKIVK